MIEQNAQKRPDMTSEIVANGQSEVETVTKIKIKQKVKPPNLFNVVYLNDDTTPFDFVCETLIRVFGHSLKKAEQLTLDVHELGSAIVATLTFELAEHKVYEVKQLASLNQYPLCIRIEEVF